MNGRNAVSFELADFQPWDLKRRWLMISIFILVFGLFFGLVDGLISGVVFSSMERLRDGLLFGVVFGLISGLRVKISTEDARHFKWAKLISFFTWGKILAHTIKRTLVICLVLGLVFGLGDGLVDNVLNRFRSGLSFGLSMGLPFCLVEGVIIKSSTISYFETVRLPYHRLKAGLLLKMIQLIIVIFWFVILYSSIGLIITFKGVVYVVLLMSPFILYNIPLIEHFVLRTALSLEKKAPLRYVKFLNEATEARILERDGGQWRFRHQLLQDYFAKL